MSERGQITADQYEMLMRPLKGSRIAKRSQGGKSLSYLESWDVRAHLIRTFGFGNFDMEMLDYHFMGTREYQSSGDKPKAMVEVIYSARMQLTIRSTEGLQIATYAEAAVGSASGPASMLGEHHDNALKTAASDALKRCAINLGTQFGLGLYDNGSTREVIRMTVVTPEGVKQKEQITPEQVDALSASVGAKDPRVATEEPPSNEGHIEPAPEVDPSSTEAMESNGTAADIANAQHAGPVVTPEEDAKRRKQMFALFKDAGFPASGDEAREERLGYCNSVLDRNVESSNDLTHAEVGEVIKGLRAIIESEKAGVSK